MGKASRKKSQKNREKKQAVQRNARDLRKGTGVFKDRQVSFLLFAVLTLTFLTFAPTFLNDFTNWDDDMYIRDNPLVQSLSSDNIETMFAPDEEAFVGGNYHPLTILTLAINYQISGLQYIAASSQHFFGFPSPIPAYKGKIRHCLNCGPPLRHTSHAC